MLIEAILLNFQMRIIWIVLKCMTKIINFQKGKKNGKNRELFKKSINSSMDNNKISLIEDIEDLYARENLSSNKGIFYILLEAIKFFSKWYTYRSLK